MKTKSNPQAQPTAGEWSVNYDASNGGSAQICADEAHHVFCLADCYQGEASTFGRRGKCIVSEEEMLANACVMAAAKELFAALEDMILIGEYRDMASDERVDCLFPKRFHAALAAIAKAKRIEPIPPD